MRRRRHCRFGIKSPAQVVCSHRRPPGLFVAISTPFFTVDWGGGDTRQSSILVRFRRSVMGIVLKFPSTTVVGFYARKALGRKLQSHVLCNCVQCAPVIIKCSASGRGLANCCSAQEAHHTYSSMCWKNANRAEVDRVLQTLHFPPCRAPFLINR